jgi:hypothetical protein
MRSVPTFSICGCLVSLSRYFLAPSWEGKGGRVLVGFYDFRFKTVKASKGRIFGQSKFLALVSFLGLNLVC